MLQGCLKHKIVAISAAILGELICHADDTEDNWGCKTVGWWLIHRQSRVDLLFYLSSIVTLYAVLPCSLVGGYQPFGGTCRQDDVIVSYNNA